MKYDEQEMNRRVYRGYEIKREDPFGFWRVQTKEGGLNQSFTMVSMATNAIDEHLKKSGLLERKTKRSDDKRSDADKKKPEED